MADLELQVVFLQPTKVEEDNKILVFYCSFPSDKTVTTMDVKLLVEVNMAGDSRPIERNALPLFDYQKTRVLWAYSSAWQGKTWGAQKTYLVDFGKYFTLQSRDEANVGNSIATSLILEPDTGLPAIGLLNPTDKNIQAVTIYTEKEILTNSIAQKRQDPVHADKTKWFNTALSASSVPAEYTWDHKTGGRSVLFNNPPNLNVEYVYNISAAKNQGNHIYLDLMTSVNFSNLYKDNTLVWQRYTVDVGFPAPSYDGYDGFCPVMTTNKSNTAQRLYLYQPDHNALNFTFIELRKDGSVPQPTNTFKAPGPWRVPVKCDREVRNLCVLLDKNVVLITYHDLHQTKGHTECTMRGIRATVDNDGAIQQTTFQVMQMNMDPKYVIDAWAGSSNCGMLVPKDFLT